jgi:hypothetical protein
MANAWQLRGKRMANAWQLHGKRMAKHGNCMATAWQTHGNCIGIGMGIGFGLGDEAPGSSSRFDKPQPSDIVKLTSGLLNQVGSLLEFKLRRRLLWSDDGLH